MKGYKGMNADMVCRGKQYEIGKTYTESKAELCRSGMHYCKNLRDVFYFYIRNDDNRFFEVEANEIATDGRKSVADKLTVVRELEPKEINHSFYGDGKGDSCYNYFGNGYGCSNGNGNHYGYADDYSNGDGYGNGYGYGDVDGYGYGDSYINGDGRGNGKGYGDDRKPHQNIQKILIFYN